MHPSLPREAGIYLVGEQAATHGDSSRSVGLSAHASGAKELLNSSRTSIDWIT